MDENKLKKLRQIEYSIRKCCGLCGHSTFMGSDLTDWGMCVKLTYNHQKHSEGLRKLSVNRYGYCEQYKQSRYIEERMDKFTEFLEE